MSVTNYQIIDQVSDMDHEPTFRYGNKLKHYLSYITVEPTMVLYMMAFMTTSVVEQSFYIYKACTVNHGYNETICNNINDKKYENITKEVQLTSATFHMWNSIAGHAAPIVLAFFMGAWSDKRGRKLPLLLGLFGKLYFSAMIVVNTLKKDWPVEYVIYTATFPSALTGADVAIFSAAITYLVDVSSQKNRTIRVTILEVCYLATMPTGVALGSYLFRKVLNQSYTYMFLINTTLMLSAVIYTLLRLEWRSSPTQKPLSEANNIFLDFFDYNHVKDTIQTLGKKRPDNKRRFLLMLIVMTALYVFQRDEREVMYMYCQLAFNWTLNQFSTFRTFQSGLQDLVLLFAIPVMSRLFDWRDTVIIMIGAAAHTTARVFYSTAKETLAFYIGGVFASFGPIVAPVVRSLVSKIVTSSEKGKAFSVLAAADNAIPLISGVCYSALYSATIHSNPHAIFYLTMATQIGVFILILYIHMKTDKGEFEVEMKESIKPSDGETDRQETNRER
nr:proton-coupled folate transporter [Leptinotarsa decemlineata]